MATRHRLDHDLDPNQHRYLGGRGVDATFTAGGDLTLGQGNYFKITPASTAILRRISAVDWTSGSTVVLEPTVTTTFAPGSSSGSGFYPIETPTGAGLEVEAGVPIAVSFNGSTWKVHKAADDHLVKARNADATTVGGLMEKTADSPTVTRELTTESGVEKVRFNATPAVPVVGGSWLYTGSIQATNLLDPVVAFVKTYDGNGWGIGDSSLFTALPGGVAFEHKAVGALKGLDTVGSETIALVQGDRVAFFFDNPTDGHKYYWICTVTTLGDGSTKAVVTKSNDTLVHGATFKVAGVGAEYEHWYWQLWTDDPIPDPALDLVWVYNPTYQDTTTYNLLTSTEVSKAGTVTRETSVIIPGGSSGGVPFDVAVYEMLNGIGLSEIPQGVVNWEVLAYVVADNPTATTFIRAFLSTERGESGNFAYGNSRPIHNTAPTVLQFQGTIPAARACNPTDKLSAVFYGYSDSQTDITIKLVFNCASHATRVQTPLTVASYGTLDHQLLTMDSRGFVAGEEADAEAYAHPERAIAPGRRLAKPADIVASSTGLFSVPAKSNFVKLSGTEDLIGCSTEGWTVDSEMEVMVMSARKFLPSQSVPDGYAAFGWGAGDTGYGADYNELSAYQYSIHRFRFVGSIWRLCSSMNV